MWQHFENALWLLPGYEALSEIFELGSAKTAKSARRKPVKDKHSGNGNFRSLGLRYGYSSIQGWRERMEDAHVAVQLRRNLSTGMDVFDGAGLFAVCDGHGGAQVAKFCARHLPTEMSAAGGRGRTVSEALHESFHSLDRLLQNPRCSDELVTLADDSDERGPSAHACGCTLAACCMLKGGEVFVANAGDCRVVLSRQGYAMDLSQDHKPDLPAEHARIRNAGGRLVDKHDGQRKASRINGGLNVSRSIGDFKYKQNESLPANSQMVSCTPEIMNFCRAPQDEFLLIACDGVWDVLSSQQVVDFVRQHLTGLREGSVKPSEVAEDVLEMCISPNLSWTDGLGGDNMTLMIVVFDDQPVRHTWPGRARAYSTPLEELGRRSYL